MYTYYYVNLEIIRIKISRDKVFGVGFLLQLWKVGFKKFSNFLAQYWVDSRQVWEPTYLPPILMNLCPKIKGLIPYYYTCINLKLSWNWLKTHYRFKIKYWRVDFLDLEFRSNWKLLYIFCWNKKYWFFLEIIRIIVHITT